MLPADTWLLGSDTYVGDFPCDAADAAPAWSLSCCSKD